MKKSTIIILILSLFQLSVFAQEDSISFDKLTLKDAQVYAVKHNKETQNAGIDMEIAKYQKWETTAMGLPQLSIKGSYQYIFEVPVMELGGMSYIPNPAEPDNPFNHTHGFETSQLELGQKSSFTADFTVSQLVFSGEYIVGLKAAKIYMNLSRKGLEKKEHEIKENIAKTYNLILISEESIKVLDSMQVSLEKLLAETKQIQKAGFAESTDVKQLELNLKNTENSVISFTKQRDVLYRLLKFQAGIDANQEIKLEANLSEITLSAETASLASSNFNANSSPTMQLMEVQEQLSELTLKREQSTYLPSVFAFYRHQEQLEAPAFNMNPPDVLGVTIEIPIFSSGQRYSRVQQKKLEHIKIQNSKMQAEQGLYLDFMQTQSDYIAAANTLANQKQTKELSKQIYENTLIKYKAGTESSLLLTQAQSQYFQALSAYYSSLNTLLEKEVKMKSQLNMY